MKTLKFFLFFLQHLPKLLFSKKDFLVKIDDFEIYVQPRSDVFLILYETFIKEYYLPKKDLVTYEVIIDAGAYIGDFTLWANRKLKPKLIIALEPDPNSYNLLCKNVVDKKCVLLEKALFNNERATLVVKKGQSGSYISNANKGIQVEAITLTELIEQYNIKCVDYLKVDIEGGEKHLLTEENSNLFKTKVKFISMETHRNTDFGKKQVISYFEKLGFDIIERLLFNGNYQIEAYNSQIFKKCYY